MMNDKKDNLHIMLEDDLRNKLEESGRVRSIDLLRADIRNYRNLKIELQRLDQEYATEVMSREETVYLCDEEIKKIKSPGYSNGLGGHVETLDHKITRLEEKKKKAKQEVRKFFSENNYNYFNRKWVLMSRITAVESALEQMNEEDRRFIVDLYVEPIGFKKVMKKYRIENDGNVYRKASDILKKVL